MCGIAGFSSANTGKLSEYEFASFNSSLSHRGPDSSGILRTKFSWLGHNRLSIIDLSEFANQPLTVHYQNSRFSIIFNGEIYNYPEIKSQLISVGHKFESQSDTEVVLRSFIEWGVKCYAKFNGMWALAIYDHNSHSLHLCRDRFGVKPLYLYFKHDDIFFASEVKAFSMLPKSIVPKFDKSLFEFLIKRPNNKSELRRPICCLPAGHYVTIHSDRRLESNKWWHLDNNIPSIQGVKDDDVIRRFHDLFLSSLKIRMRSDARVCSSLSGGMDSSTVVSVQAAKLKDALPPDYKTFIFEFRNSDQSELKYALSVCDHTNFPYTLSSHDSTSNAIDPQTIIECIYASEQLGNLQIGPYLLYRSMQAEGYKVSIDGHGSDELLGGYSQFTLPSLADAYVTGGEKSFQETMMAWSNDDGSYSIDPASYLEGIKQLVRNGDPRCDGLWMQRMRKEEFQSKTLPWILNTYDKVPMRHGVEVRSPFLDYRLVAFSFALRNRFLTGSGYTKSILREAFKDYLPAPILKRRNKKGFLPTKYFFLESPAIKELIADVAMSPCFKFSNQFHGINAAKHIQNALVNNDLDTLQKLWPLIQVTLFKNKWESV